VLCTPVDTYLPYLHAIDQVCAKNALVMDVGSVKASVLKEVNSRPWRNFSFVGCHPMVGSHKRGIGAVNPELYKEGLVLLTPDRKTCSCGLKKAAKFWKTFTPRVITLTPEAHDKLVGEASHLPHAVAACLMHTVSNPAFKVAATGLRDTTRIAAAASSIWQPIFRSNRKVLLVALNRFEQKLQIFKKLLQSRNPKKLAAFLDQAQRKRKAL
jgi:prephenate dehydrogenase